MEEKGMKENIFLIWVQEREADLYPTILVRYVSAQFDPKSAGPRWASEKNKGL